ncbi:hypothetical protein V9T40_000509 [Parthenolecanium corni]|uniref:2-oxoisovalerate dehydrogenase subunit alpha n=1 Tax=Parthenolecanium corni TaxID=536013 RepID=A0AAN9Y1P3_9HEMI
MFAKSLRSFHLSRKLYTRHYCLAAQEPSFNRIETQYVNNLKIVEGTEQIPIYRLLDVDGELLNASEFPSIDKNLVQRFYKYMRTLKEVDKILYECQRQGRISFYMTGYGEEGVQIGSAAGLNDDDLVFPQYRETGVLLWRGFTIDQCIDQCFGNKKDAGKGKQMPIHYGSKDHHYVTVSSPLGTQLPQAVGAAYSYKMMKNKKCTIVYFGEGAASEGDAHAAFNFAATLQCPIIFFCRNNGYAISTPATEQYRGDGIAGRGSAYGIAALKVDGNDVLGVYKATRIARNYAVENNSPIIVEAMTYRRGHHSTSDDSTAYRRQEEIDQWKKLDPIVRLQNFMEKYGMWDNELQSKWVESIRKQILNSVVQSEKVKKPKWQEMFSDVYHDLPPHLQEQQQYMENHVKKYKQYYPLNDFEQS